MQVWDGVSGSRISFDWPTTTTNTATATSGESPASASMDQTIAHMTENLNLTAALVSRLDELGGLSIFDRSKVERIDYGPRTETLDLSTWPVVEISDGRRLAARLLVGADGANSLVRTFAGIEIRGWGYDRHAVVATVRLEGNGWGGEGRKTAYQRFLPTGPVALLPVYPSISFYHKPTIKSCLSPLSPHPASRQLLNLSLVYTVITRLPTQVIVARRFHRHGQRRLSSLARRSRLLTRPESGASG